VIHTKQVVWDLEAPLGLWIDETAVTPAKIDESELYGAIGLEVFRQPGEAPPVEFGSGNAVLRAVAQRLLRSDGSKRAEKYIYDRAVERDGVTVQEALDSKYVNKNGLRVPYKLSDLRYDLKRGWLAIDVYADDADA
jgi:hypothetical protein